MLIRTALVALALLCVAPATAMAAVPAVTTGAASNQSPNSATVAGSLNPNGRVSTWYFQYGTTKSYGARTTAQDAGSGTKRVPVSVALTGLQGKTTYHYRLVATNSSGTNTGADKTFKTPEAPTVSTIVVNPNPATYLKPVVVNGFLIGPRGGPGKQVALQGRAFPFTSDFAQIGNAVVTDANSGYQFVIGAFGTSQLRLVDLSDKSIVSPVATLNVASQVSLYARRIGAHKRRIRFTGFVTPKGSAAAVVLERRKGKGWDKVAVALPHGRPKSDRFQRTMKTRGGTFRVVTTGQNGYVEGTSKTLRLKRR
jgi:hypothetical protein